MRLTRKIMSTVTYVASMAWGLEWSSWSIINPPGRTIPAIILHLDRVVADRRRKIPRALFEKPTRGRVRYQYNPNKKKFRKTLKKQAQAPGRLPPLVRLFLFGFPEFFFIT